MALVGGTATNDWQSKTEDDDDDVGPVTSRSPSFVAPPTSRPREPLESLVVIAEPRRHESGVMPIVRLEEDDRWGARHVSLRVAALRLEEAACGAKREKEAAPLLADAAAIEPILRGLAARMGDEIDALLSHAYEWATNVLTRAEASIVGHVWDDLPVSEYSSLFVRTILDPMLDAAIASRSRAGDARGEEDLRALREAAFWTNWTVGRAPLNEVA
jgi:hypothetical protein